MVNVFRIGDVINVVVKGKPYRKQFPSVELAAEFLEKIIAVRDDEEACYSLVTDKAIYPLSDDHELFMVSEQGNVVLEDTSTPLPKILDQVVRDNPHMEQSLAKFWTLCLLNPDNVVRDSLFDFVSHYDFAITEHGYLMTYKAVRKEEQFVPVEGKENLFTKDVRYTDKHTGTMDIRLGEPCKMDRQECDNDSSRDCSYGLMCSPAV